ncbi:hypothetical protein FOYG_14882 [Fusarium oxysporum NRRL 32931]|uniref:Uncharacterized protein n=1 Tax=Fusarium oxysporum NRRL 32931 TaxID=660029 RepID=W9HPK3_FUSOX|nr:hypothetical protein FOYG_14882 [Fusarium oxysporum NRRL 32931]
MAHRSIIRDTKITTCGHKDEQRPRFRFEAFEPQLPAELMCKDIDFSYPGTFPAIAYAAASHMRNRSRTLCAKRVYF